MGQPKAWLRLLTFCSGQQLLFKNSPPNLAAHCNNDFSMLVVPTGQEFGHGGVEWLTLHHDIWALERWSLEGSWED